MKPIKKAAKAVKRKPRTCFIAVPIDSDWGARKAVGPTWLMAWDRRKESEKEAKNWAKYNHGHKVIEFREVKKKGNAP